VWIGTLQRLLFIALVLTKHIVGYLLARATHRAPRLRHLLHLRGWSNPERLRVLFEDLGGSFIKFGQMLALQPDILPLEYCNALFNLLDRVPPFPYRDVERIVREELGRTPSEIFDQFDESPLAAASIGQVHVAYLQGKKVAVKVQRPDVNANFAGDIRLMSGTMRLIRYLQLKPFYWLLEPMGEFVAWTVEELDYRHEARYIEQLWLNALDNLREQVPKLYPAYTTKRTLVTEFLPGMQVLSYLRARQSGDERVFATLEEFGFDAHEVSANIIDNFLGDVFRHGMFHADLHPANLMILPGNVVGYIDFGITGTISAYSRRNLVELTLSYTRGDIDGMCASFFKVSAIDDNSDLHRFREGLRRASETWYDVEGVERRLRKNFTLVMLDMLRLSRATNVWPERDVIKYIRSAIAIDGLITRLAPSFNLGRHLETACDRYLTWEMRRSFLTYNSVASWFSAGMRILEDGPVRAARFLRWIGTQESDSRSVEPRHRASAADPARQSVYLAGFVFVTATINATSGDPLTVGINLGTAALLLALSATVLLFRSLGRTGVAR
jgi:ubiquinone biosynthesis protein